MKLWKALFCGAICSMLLASVPQDKAFANEFNESERTSKHEAARIAVELIDALEYQGKSLCDLGVSQEIGLSNLSIGDAVFGYEVTEGNEIKESFTKYWPLFANDEVVLLLREVENEDCEKGYVLTVEGVEAIAASFSDGDEIVALVDESGLLEKTLCLQEGAGTADSLLVGDCGTIEESKLFDLSRDDVEVASKDSMIPLVSSLNSAKEIVHSGEARAASSYSSADLGMNYGDITSQEKNGVRYGVCWAATASTVINYLTRSQTTAFSVCDGIGHGYTGGDEDDIVAALSKSKYANSYTSINGTRRAGAISSWELQTWISSGIPVIAALKTDAGNNHTVTICGWLKSTDGALILTVANTGTESFEVMKCSAGNVFGLYYNGTTYKWTRSTIVMPGWQKPFGGYSWSYLNNNGVREKGWFKYDGWYYHFDDSGFMETNAWISYNGEWYYVNKDGQMEVNNWVRLVDKWYYFDDEGVAARSEWKYLNSNWYAFNSDCQMRTGWYYESGNWYYLRTAANTPGGGPEGSMLRSGTWTINGTSYRFDSNGVCLNP